MWRGAFFQKRPSPRILFLKFYKYGSVVLLGSTVTNNAERLSNLLALSKAGMSFDFLVALGSNRPLYPDVESVKILTNFLLPPLLTTPRREGEALPRTEEEAWTYLFKHSNLPSHWPKPVILDTLAPAGQVRARTEDTIRDFVKHPEILHGPLLFVSSQPFGLLQKEIIRSILKDVEFEVTADSELVKKYGLDSSFSVQNVLDTMARLTYQVLRNLDAGVVQECPNLHGDVVGADSANRSITAEFCGKCEKT